MILFINACVRSDSRTRKLADALLSRLNGTIKELTLAELSFPTPDESFITYREHCVFERNFSDPLFSMAKDFASADTIVIAAPFWDLSFPATLKQYFEQINIPHVTFYYNEHGVPCGLCKAKKLYYITTAGGPIFNDAYGFGYVRELAQTFYGIPDVEMIKAEGLDIVGADVDSILKEAENRIQLN